MEYTVEESLQSEIITTVLKIERDTVRLFIYVKPLHDYYRQINSLVMFVYDHQVFGTRGQSRSRDREETETSGRDRQHLKDVIGRKTQEPLSFSS